MTYYRGFIKYFCLTLLLTLSTTALAEKAAKAARAATAPAAPPSASSAAQPTPSSSSSAVATPPNANGEKLDVTDIEKKYWASKDTDFSVVQNRAFSKAKRFSLSPTLGSLINDPYSSGPSWGVAARYYFTERDGMELSYTQTNTYDNKAVQALTAKGAYPDFGKESSFVGLAYNWVPIYAKMSLLNSRIIYFDLDLSPGIGQTTYQQQVSTGNSSKTAPTLFLNMTQHFFLNQTFAIRFEIDARWYNQDILAYRGTSSNGVSTGALLRTDQIQTSLYLLGFDIFY